MIQSRRSFLKKTGLTAASVPLIVPSRVLGDLAPSKRVTLGMIGLGGQGTNRNLRIFLAQQDAQVLTVCDADFRKTGPAKKMVDEAYGHGDCKVTRDFREILADPAIDAVVISTPDHWHVPMSIMAMEAGKHVFCEKPTLSIHEGRMLTDAFAKTDRVFQAGIEDRSTIHFHKMVEFVKNGAIGELEQVKVVMPHGNRYANDKVCDVPDGLDWNLWQGPAAAMPFSQRRVHSGAWRQINMYSKGTILDIGTHLFDTAQIGVNDPDVCPVEVSGSGEIPENMLTDVPVRYDLTYRYGNGVEVSLKNGEGRAGWDPDVCYLEFIGSKGWIRRKTWTAGLEASDREILRRRYTAEESRHWPFPDHEHRNFLDCLQSGGRTTYMPIDLHQMSTALHMGVICIQLGRKLQWDPGKEEFVNDDEANGMRTGPEYRDWQRA